MERCGKGKQAHLNQLRVDASLFRVLVEALGRNEVIESLGLLRTAPFEAASCWRTLCEVHATKSIRLIVELRRLLQAHSCARRACEARVDRAGWRFGQ